MLHSWKFGWQCLGLALMALAAVAADAPRPPDRPAEVVVQWQFDKDADFQGWQPNAHVADAAVRGGALCGRAVGADPILMGPLVEIPAAPMQCVEICMKATDRASAELFWTETVQGRFGGFSGAKHQVFTTIGDGQFHVYRIFPFWHAAKKIVRLRLDPPDAGRFEVRSIRIVREATAGAASAKSWNAQQFKKTWHRLGQVVGESADPILLSPLLSVSAADHAFVCVRMATDRVGTGRLFCVSRSQFGWDRTTFTLRPDGKMHSYNIDAGPLKTWHDQILLLGLQVPEGGTTRIDSIEIARDPSGPADVEVTYFGPTDGINRAGRPTGVSCTLRNLGGDPAENLAATLVAPPGVQVLDAAQKKIDRLSLYLPQTIEWQVRSETLGKIDLAVKVECKGVATISSAASIELTASPAVPKTSYVPEPRPVQCKYDLGAFYFPGWSTSGRWQPIRNYPCRKPILGWYDEANPECADWQIKWAVEHGVKFFMVDWYWVRGQRQLEHWVHDAFMKAKYRKYMKWAVMWANHNPPKTHSLEDWRQVTQYWIDNYFGMPEYYRIDNRPAVFLWSPRNVREDLGGSSQAAGLYALSQEMARKAGYPGITFVAMSSHETPQRVDELKAEGFHALTSYHGFQLAWRQAHSDYFPYAGILDTCREVWQQQDQRSQGLPYFPIVDTGWDARPWHGDKTMVAYGRTPELFGKLCRMARQYCDETGKRIVAIGPWNEWGEGSYIEPYAEYGFQDLDQLRAAFCEPGDWPPNLIPADVGRGPYDLPPWVAKTAWEFNTGGDPEGWSPGGQIAALEVKGGLLLGRSTGSDPVLMMPSLQVEAQRMHRVAFRMRADAKGQVQIFWATTLTKMSEKTSAHVDVPGDGQLHDYEVDLAGNPHWRGVITSLRFDPAVKADVNFAIDYIRLR